MTEQITFTKEEHAYLVSVFNKPAINPLSPEAAKVVEIIQSIVTKIHKLTETDENGKHPGTQNGAAEPVQHNDKPKRNRKVEAA